MYYNKKKCFNNFDRIGLGYEHGGRAIVLGQQYGCRAWFSLATHSQARAQRSKIFLFLVFAYVLAFMLAFALQQVKQIHDSRTFRNSVHVQSQV